MNSLNYTFLIIFGIIGYMIIADENVSKYISFQLKILYLNFEKLYFMIKIHPKNPITNWIMARKCDKIAKELEEEFFKKSTKNI